jgi:hypothetical protein
MPFQENSSPTGPQSYDPKQRVGNQLSVTQLGEKKICEIKRHPIGLLAVYFMCGFLLVLVAILGFGAAPHLFPGVSTSQIDNLTLAVLLIVALLCAGYALIETKVYWGNSWVVTSDSLTQVDQNSLFSRQSSQLSLGNLEDVSAEQNGILSHMFNYGLLRVETAGERSKFVFAYCPNPNFYAQQILAAREAFEQGRHYEDQSYHGEGSYAQQQGGIPGTAYPDNSPDKGVNINTPPSQ